MESQYEKNKNKNQVHDGSKITSRDENEITGLCGCLKIDVDGGSVWKLLF